MEIILLLVVKPTKFKKQ